MSSENSYRNSLSYIVLHKCGNFIGLNPFGLDVDNNIIISYYTPVWSILITIFFIYLSSLIFIDRITHKAGDTTVLLFVDLQLIVVRCFEITTSWLLIAFNQKRLKNIIKKMNKIDKLSLELGIGEKYNIHKISLCLLLFNSLFILSASWSGFYGDRIYKDIWFIFNIIRVVTYDTILIFVGGNYFVKRKFKLLNDKLELLTFQYSGNSNKHGLIKSLK